MAGNLTFNVDANDRASGEFAAVAAQLKELGRELDKIDGRNVKAKVTINAPGAAQIAQLDRARAALAEIDGKNARAKVEITGTPGPAEVRQLRAAAKALRELDGINVNSAINIVGNLPDPKDLRASARALKQLQDVGAVHIHVTVTGAIEALADVAALRAELRGLPERRTTRVDVDVDRSIADKFSAIGKTIESVFTSAGGAIAGLAKPLAALGAAGGAVSAIGGITGALSQLAPAALLIPGAVLGVASAFAALKIGMSGVGDAIKSGDLTGLAPSAAAAVTAIRGLQTTYDGLKRSVQGALFAGLAADISRVGNTLLPTLKTGLTGIAQQLNVVASESLKAMQSPFFKDDLSEIFSNTAGMVREVGSGIGDLISGFVGLGAVGSQYLPALGTAIGDVATKFKHWVDEGVETGRIKEMIDGAIAGFRDLGAIAGNIGSILSSVFTGLGGAMTSPLASLRDLTASLAAFFASAQAQGPLQALGETMRVVGGVLRDVLIAGLTALAPIVEKLSPLISTFASVAGDVLVAAFEKLGPPIQRLIDRLVPVLGPALEGIGLILTNTVIPALASFVDWLAGPGFDTASVMFQNFALTVTHALQTVLSVTSGALAGLQGLFATLGMLPGPFQETFLKASVAAGGAKKSIDDFRGTLDKVETKQVDALQQTLDGIAAKKYIGTVTVLATTDGAQGAIIQTVQLANDTRATIKIAGDGSPAILTVGQTKYTIDQTTGTLKVLGDVAPGESSLEGFRLKVDSTTGVMTIEGNNGPVDAKTTASVTFANGSTGTITIEGDPTPVNGKITESVTFADGSKGTITIDGNQTPANGKIDATVTYADGSTGTIKVDADDALARSKVAGTVQWIANQNPTLTVDVIYSGSSPAAVRAAGSGGLIAGSGSGIRRYAGGGVVPGYAPGVDDQLALISRGESVLVPELTRSLGASRIMAANREASGGRPGTAVGSLAGMMDGSIRGTGGPGGMSGAVRGAGPAGVMDVRRGAGGAGYGSSAALISEVRGLRSDNTQLRGALERMEGAIQRQRPFVVEDRSGNPVETARATALAIAVASG